MPLTNGSRLVSLCSHLAGSAHAAGDLARRIERDGTRKRRATVRVTSGPRPRAEPVGVALCAGGCAHTDEEVAVTDVTDVTDVTAHTDQEAAAVPHDRKLAIELADPADCRPHLEAAATWWVANSTQQPISAATSGK